jgi:hypothetical protein
VTEALAEALAQLVLNQVEYLRNLVLQESMVLDLRAVQTQVLLQIAEEAVAVQVDRE